MPGTGWIQKGKIHIFVLIQILEHTREWNSTLCVLVDFMKAFDSLHRDSL